MEKICATCRAGDFLNVIGVGYCHARPAAPTDPRFPQVYATDWCLDWQPKERPHTETPSKGKRAWSDELKPTEKHAELAQRLKVNMGEEWGKFKNYCLAHDKRYANFEAAFRNWLVSSVNMNGGKR